MKMLYLNFFVAVLLICVSSCKPIASQTVPYAYVNFNFNINTDPSYWPLRSNGGYVSVIGGALNSGIIIYRTGDTFYAYDRTCPYDPGKGVVAVVKSNSIFAKDAVCGSQFSMPLGGIVQVGPSSLPLKQYQVSFNANTGDVSVYN